MTIPDNLKLQINNNNNNAMDTSHEKYLTNCDKLFLKDYIIKASVGLHDDEKTSHQRMRFSLTVYIEAKPYSDDCKLSNVIDYDFLIGCIHKVMDNRHNNLVEVIAHKIANLCLADKRMLAINIIVEKLDRLEAGILGYQISRCQSDIENNIYKISDTKPAAE